MVEVRIGQSKKPEASRKLVEFFNLQSELEGSLYIGYPIIYSAGESTVVDALWISQKYGIVIFDLIEGTNFENREAIQDALYSKIQSELIQYPDLNKHRKFMVGLDIITYAPACSNNAESSFKIAFSDKDLLGLFVQLEEWRHSELYHRVIAVIQSVVQLQVKTNRQVGKENSRGAKIKRLEESIANLDSQQEKAVIEYFEGIQRIRGLAGSGKTIVLALKAAYLHALNPDWDIAVTFHTRSLKQQFKDLIEKFCAEKTRQPPNWEKLRILQAWGSQKNNGIYYEFCLAHGIEYFPWREANNMKNASGESDKQVFDFICRKALADINKSGRQIITKYDAILVDEAQDVSESFLNLCYEQLKTYKDGKPKRLIYAYDELQKLNEGQSLRPPKKIFNVDARDTILDKCYRNSRPLLVTAHALGFGVYREKGLVQFFDHPDLWKEVGYKVTEGNLMAGQTVTLVRDNESSPEHLENHSDIEDLIVFKKCSGKEEQAQWIADQIEKDLKEEELLTKDIIVINPMALTTKDEVAKVRSMLLKKGINNHIAGEYNSDVFFERNSIAFTGIYRAKGNEVPMVYIMNAQNCYGSESLLGDFDLITRRNTLFTAITRSKAWVRLCGFGDRMDKLIQEYEQIKANHFTLKFTYPTPEEINKLNVIHRDITDEERKKLERIVSTAMDFKQTMDRIKNGESLLEEFPKDMQEWIKPLLETT